MADDVVRAVEAAALEGAGERRHAAVMLGPGDAAAFAFAMDQPAFQVEGHAVAALGLAHELGFAAGLELVQGARVDVVEVPEAVRMPERPFREDEPGRLALRVGGLENFRQIVHRRTSQMLDRFEASIVRLPAACLMRRRCGQDKIVIRPT